MSLDHILTTENVAWFFAVPIAFGLLLWILYVLRGSKNSTVAAISRMLLDWFEA